MGVVASTSRLQSARVRARTAQYALAAGGVAAFLTATAFARMTHPGHGKGPVTPLAAPQQFVDVVRQNQLEAGIIAPFDAPPGVATTVS